MNTDTPRTDAACFRQPAFERDFVESDFASTLERELTAALARIAKLESERKFWIENAAENELARETAETQLKLALRRITTVEGADDRGSSTWQCAVIARAALEACAATKP